MNGINLPEPPPPAGKYAPVIVRSGFGFVSGQFPISDGKLVFNGQVGKDLSVEQGRQACRIAALNVLAQIATVTCSFTNFEGLLRLDGYIASSDDFFDQPGILDVASHLFTEVLGESGNHARTAFAVPRLPLNAPIELCVTFTA
ncbi:RidA family protein [Sulfitobacter sp. S190]|uniref:RidA family protein n=1 Tax=Sulfitobacter sp. S190 TaxID=2867022 RepID=UPI0021A84837|nr:RidA family protein [Sulfitobacter sp. S190]UWR24589.1 RidA family protein [Sulfitobacter sp. S190]